MHFQFNDDLEGLEIEPQINTDEALVLIVMRHDVRGSGHDCVTPAGFCVISSGRKPNGTHFRIF